MLWAGVSFTGSQLRAGTCIPGGLKPPFAPGYELIGVVEDLRTLVPRTCGCREPRHELWPALSRLAVLNVTRQSSGSMIVRCELPTAYLTGIRVLMFRNWVVLVGSDWITRSR